MFRVRGAKVSVTKYQFLQHLLALKLRERTPDRLHRSLENLDSKWTGKHIEHGWQSSKLASRQQNSKLASCCTSEENRIDL